MRSRWSAFAVGDFAYLWRTLHPDHPDRADTFETFRARAEADAHGRRYRKLLVLASAGPDAEGYAHVLFHADITEDRAKRSFAEHSRFTHDGTGWRYFDGVVLPDRELPRPIETLTFDAFHLAARR
jgi:SEC-C motif-containing protein